MKEDNFSFVFLSFLYSCPAVLPSLTCSLVEEATKKKNQDEEHEYSTREMTKLEMLNYLCSKFQSFGYAKRAT